jgi:NADPH2:quinone reductase
VQPPLPFIPGSEAAGEVSALGPDVADFAVGDRVICGGGFAEEAVQNTARLIRLPEGVGFEAAAAFRSNYATALNALQRGRLQGGEVLLVHAAAGGVGLATVDVGKLMGATVIGTASSDARLDVVRGMGADHVIDYTHGFRDRVKELTGGRGADVIVDPVGAGVFDESMRCVAPFGRILVVGFTGGGPSLVKTNHLLIKDAEVIGFTMGALARHAPERAARNQRMLLNWLSAGRIRPHFSHVLPLEQAAEALQLLLDRKVVGKAVLA